MRRVLVVEDNEANQRLMRILLESMGISVTCANRGDEGWKLARDGDFDVVLLDMQLPGLNGFEIAARLKARPGKATKVIAVTAMAMEGDREKSLNSGCDAYLSKPISVPEFRGTVQAFLGNALEGNGDG